MRNETEWYKTDLIGQLYIEAIIVEGNEPVLFTCLDELQQRYLVEMLDSYTGRYLIVPIITKDLLDMLQDKLTLERTFRNQNSAYLTIFSDDFNLILESIQNSEIPDELLPTSGEYLGLVTPRTKEYIQKLLEPLGESYSLVLEYYDNNKISFKSLLNIDVTLQNELELKINYETTEHMKIFVPAFQESESSIFDLDLYRSDTIICKAA